MDKNSEYYQQLQVINQMLEQSSDGPERDELISLKQNIEELLELTEQSLDSTNSEQQAYGDNQDNQNDDGLDDEYAKFMAEMSKEGAIELPNKNFETLENNLESIHIENFKNLEGKKFRAPHKHQWGQVAYHNAMICSVPEDISDISELKVKVLFLNPTHKEMLPCPYYFDLEKDCRFSEEQCRFSHGELVPYSSLQDYVEPKFENLTIGSEVLAKQSDDLWYRGKIAHILKEKCLVKFNSKNIQNVNHEEIIFEHILPLEQSENSSNEESGSESEGVEISEDEESDALKSKKHDELINKSLLVTPDTVPLGDWEKHTKGIGSKLMQKMGYIIGTGLGKEGCGIIKPVTALILPQGKSLDFCMNLKEKSKDPHLFHADNRTKSMKWKEKKNQRKINKGAQQQIKLEEMDLNKYIRWYFCRGKFAIEEKESRLLREKLKIAPIKEVNVTNFVIDKRVKLMTESIEKLKINIQQLEEKHLEPKALYRKLNQRKTDLKRLNIFGVLVQNELDRRKNNKEMAVF